MNKPVNLAAPVLVAGMLVASLLPVFAAQDLPDTHSGVVAAIFSPAATSADVVNATILADAQIVRAGAWSNVIIVADDRPDLAARLRRAGAWLVVDPGGLAGCFTG